MDEFGQERTYRFTELLKHSFAPLGCLNPVLFSRLIFAFSPNPPGSCSRLFSQVDI
jgi:hypothetical protein